jgi:hypothetical protein
MKALAPVLAVIAVVSGIVSANLWRELRVAQLTNAELRAQLAESRIAGQPAPVPLPTPAPAPVSAAPAPAAASTPVPASQQTAEQARAAGAAAATATLSTLVSTLATSTGEQDLMKDPEYRKARLTQTRIQIARSYPGLAEELGLSEREANQLFELMAVNQLNMTTELTTSITAGNAVSITTNAQDAAARTQRMQAQNREMEESIRAMLGNKYSQYQDYQQTRPARNQAVTMGSQLAAAGQPLSEAQSRALTTAMIAEQQRQRQQPATPLALPTAGSMDPQARTVMMLEDSMRRQEETNRNVLAAASAHLNASQVAVLRQQFDQQNAARRQTLTRMQEQAARQQTPPRPQ